MTGVPWNEALNSLLVFLATVLVVWGRERFKEWRHKRSLVHSTLQDSGSDLIEVVVTRGEGEAR